MSHVKGRADHSDSLLITPFRTQNTPPPMSSYTIPLPTTPIHVALSNHTDSLAVLFQGGLLQVWDLHTRVPDKKGSRIRGGGKVAEPTLRWERKVSLQGTTGRSIALGPEEQIAVLASDSERSLVTLLLGDKSESVEVEPTAERILYSPNGKPIVIHSNGSFAICESPRSFR